MYKVFTENYTAGFQDVYLYLVYLLSIILGIYIIISKNPIISVLYLIGLFCSMSLYLIMIGLYFIGLSYLLVYVGAISILFLFILMLINIRVSELLTDNNNSIPLAIFSVVCFNYAAGNILPSNTFYKKDTYDYITYLAENFYNSNLENISSTDDAISYLLYHTPSHDILSIEGKSWASILVTTSHIASIGNILYTNLFIFFIMISLILLLAMVGAIVITVNRPMRK
uniref:NADH-ubiquinone oxidoreductase chain 6 n=1 Tax=Opegrapha vulgata TaxID=543791 RepID=A0A286QSI8_9PEZI|nr:NADH dehydrogenase subunit 6 [Opegrapha vulgata]ASB29434.1 NADH dehydrogenase subunit 6 [Opegrapha vulgata]